MKKVVLNALKTLVKVDRYYSNKEIYAAVNNELRKGGTNLRKGGTNNPSIFWISMQQLSMLLGTRRKDGFGLTDRRQVMGVRQWRLSPKIVAGLRLKHLHGIDVSKK